MISVRNICKNFGKQVVLKDVSVDFEPGKTNLIIGRSGSGKTVLMKCLVGLYPVDCGGIYYDDRNFAAMSFNSKRDIRKEIGMLFQGAALFDSMNVEENVMFPLTMFTAMPEEEKKERVNFVLKRVDLENVNKQMPSELSGGMKKRVAIARAIALNPRYLFCDEPNSGLDPQTASVIDELIKEITLEYGITTIVNTHDMNSVLSIGDKIAFIYQGQKWWEGSKQEIMESDNAELKDFVFSTELTRRLGTK